MVFTADSWEFFFCLCLFANFDFFTAQNVYHSISALHGMNVTQKLLENESGRLSKTRLYSLLLDLQYVYFQQPNLDFQTCPIIFFCAIIVSVLMESFLYFRFLFISVCGLKTEKFIYSRISLSGILKESPCCTLYNVKKRYVILKWLYIALTLGSSMSHNFK